jgi:putative tryptophan/tyrosine transport system substrate-binding protein
MRIRIVLLMLGAFLWASVSGAPQRFCLAYFVTTTDTEDCTKGLIDGLRQAGLTEGTNYTLDRVNIQGELKSLSMLAGSIAQAKYDLIFTLSTPVAKALADRIHDVPIVATYLADPVVAGVADSPDKHPANVTGISTMTDFPGMIKLIRTLMPNAQTIGTLYSPGEPNSLLYLKLLKHEAEVAGLTVVAKPAMGFEGVPPALQALVDEKVDAICQITDNTCLAVFATISNSARGAGIPLFSFTEGSIRDRQALAAVSRDYSQCGRDAAALGIRILKGETPAKIPFTPMTQSSIFFDTEYAKAVGIVIPDDLLKTAGHVYSGPVKP